MLRITGAKGKISDVDSFLEHIRNFSKNNEIIIQVFNAEMIYEKNHLASAVEHAVRAMENKFNTTNSLEMEILLYSSGERQLKVAIPKMGVKKGESNMAFVFYKKEEEDNISDKLINKLFEELCLVREDNVLDGDKGVLKRFGIQEKEMKTVTKDKYGNLILEKVAMVDIIK